MRRLNGRLSRKAALLVGVIMAIFGSECFAGLEEMIVTVRKREENLQKVPIAVDVIGAEEITARGIRDTADIATYTSSMQFDQGFAPQDTRIVMRGLSPTRGRQNVATLLDGIDISSQAIGTNGGTLLINPRLFDAARVEVVKGPQNALYGRTAFAGAINYVSKEPSDELDARIGADLGSDEIWELKGTVSGPLVGDTLLGLFTGAAWNEDGFYDNSTTGDRVGGTDGYAVAGALTWNIGDNISIRPRIDYTDDSFGPTPYAVDDPGFTKPPARDVPPSALTPAPGFGTSVLNPFFTSNPFPGPHAVAPEQESTPIRLSRNPRTGVDYPGTDRKITRASLIMDFDLGATKIVSLSQYAKLETFQFEDASRNGDPNDADAVQTGKAYAGAEFWADEDRELTSTELRWESNSGGWLDWLVGASYWKEDTHFQDGSINCIMQSPQALPGVNCADVLSSFDNGAGTNPRNPYEWHQETESIAFYGLVDWQFLEDWKIVGELRYTDEEQKVSGPAVARLVDPTCSAPGGFCFFPLGAVINPTTSVPGKATDDFWSPKATLQWDPTDTMMYYASVALANKPAGIAPLTAGSGGFDPDLQAFEREKMTVYEVGGKTSWIDETLVVNAAVFYQDYTDKQLSTQTTDPVTGLPTVRAINAAKASVAGLELEVTWLPIDALTFSVSYTYLDTEYDDLKPLSPSASQIAAAGNCTVVDTPGTAPGSTPTCQLNLDGRQLEDAPENSVVGFGRLTLPFVAENVDWFLEADAIYEGDKYESSSNDVTLQETTYWNFRTGLESAGWDVMVYVDNATDEQEFRTGFRNPDTRYLAQGFPYNGMYIKSKPRVAGIRANVYFGGDR